METDVQKHYELLDLKPGASPAEIETAYKQALWLYSDQNPEFHSFFSEDEATYLRECVVEAYNTLLAETKTTDPKSFQDKLQPQFYYNHPEEVLGEAKAIKEPLYNENFDEELSLLEQEIDPSLENELLKHSFYDGLILKKLRLKKRIPLGLISAQTNIGLHHLKAIESNSFSTLPAAVFVKSYVKQYAEKLNLDSQIVGDSYIRLYNESKNR